MAEPVNVARDQEKDPHDLEPSDEHVHGQKPEAGAGDPGVVGQGAHGPEPGTGVGNAGEGPREGLPALHPHEGESQGCGDESQEEKDHHEEELPEAAVAHHGAVVEHRLDPEGIDEPAKLVSHEGDEEPVTDHLDRPPRRPGASPDSHE